ncbi:toxin-antitoxin system YwqK family antitoxin [Winogradskyella bathintestinalis]|uniref:Nicotinic acid mononucleotide adenyltransferase n=1 Tax=Winogradskyella bathintestinalis TaxID=3035208 RepID=A0ABT7ZSG3_9FLAO|nr:nicotinic acid mononucleotide adenyltransferase [Winogradskyella bathintestinalis]MDN3491928.1 nicotinic acid mononucleotide adenyltransferase [Winogradskyella bathintestinalis]
MKKIVVVIVILCVGFTYAQDKNHVKLEKKGELTVATYFHDNGEIQQTGTFDVNGKLDGKWTSFDVEGNKLAVGNYNAGKKVGKWFFWEGDSLKEVDFVDSKIVSVNQWDNRTKVAVNR